MAVSVVMPQLGESIVEGTVAKWLVREGDTVEKDQPLIEVSTDKVDTEIPSPVAGRIGKILVAEGQTVDVGTVLTTIEEAVRPARAPGTPAPPRESPAGAPPPVRSAPRLSREAIAASRLGEVARKREEIPPAAPAREEERPRISPLVRRMAEEHGIDLATIRGTGIEGRVTKSDVLAWLSREAPTRAPERAPTAARLGTVAGTVPTPSIPKEEGFLRLPTFSVPRYEPQPGDQVIPFSRIRKRIADHMVASNVISPRVTTVAEVDMVRIAKLRETHKPVLHAEGVSLTFLPFVIAAMGRAIADYPGINASVQDESLILKKAVHVGVAVDTERGLLVPVIHDANRKGVLDLARALQDLGDRGRSRTLTPEDMTGGTIAVTNPGAKGNLFGTPVINQPHVVIVRMGEVVKRPVVVTVDGEDLIAIRPMMYLALTYDHRVVDGVTGNGALHRIREILEAGDFEL